ncbi:MAG: YitT family protein [Hyphomicrobiales bacterium]|nr:YitT family protein [Hyphomicrobiales bacterium]
MAILMATLFVAFGLVMYTEAVLVTGGTAGLALLLHHATGTGFWLVFSALNLPFYLLAAHRMGIGFALRTFAAVSLVAVFTALVPRWVAFARLDPLFATLVGGGLMGVGLLMLFRHRTALGAVNIVAMHLQERWGIRAGYFQLGLDLAIFAGAFFLLEPRNILLSVLGAAVVNLTLAINHRPGRYMGMS